MKTQSGESNDDLALKGLFLSIFGFLTSVWSLGPLSYFSEDFMMTYLYGEAIFLCTGVSILLSIMGLVFGINSLKHKQGKKWLAITGIILSTLGALQIILVIIFLLNPGPIV